VLQVVAEGRVRKAVLARVVDAAFHKPVDPLASLRFLRTENPRAHVYLIEPHPDRVFLGAAPEILAELRRGRFTATAVAGSMPRGGTDEEDLELAQRLLDSAKDRAEHDLTSEEMAEALAPRLEDMQVEKEPRVLSLARIQHLETAITGRAKEGEDILSLVQAPHPTPAVCGSPREEARTLIRSTESFDRGWYAGPVGWFDLAGEGDFVPALRAAIGAGRRWRLFAGAGIVAGSSPDEEWAETALKFEPALRALDFGAGE
jgi:isochorismate synthase